MMGINRALPVFFLLFVLSFSLAFAEGSCSGKCGQYQKSWTCQCDSQCSKYNDCCSDYSLSCNSSSSQPISGSCSGKCGQYQNSWTCQCDSQCSKYGDCCADYSLFCNSTTSSSPGSCSGKCGQYQKSWTCQCDSECSKYNDCCYDYSSSCKSSSTVTTIATGVTTTLQQSQCPQSACYSSTYRVHTLGTIASGSDAGKAYVANGCKYVYYEKCANGCSNGQCNSAPSSIYITGNIPQYNMSPLNVNGLPIIADDGTFLTGKSTGPGSVCPLFGYSGEPNYYPETQAMHYYVDKLPIPCTVGAKYCAGNHPISGVPLTGCGWICRASVHVENCTIPGTSGVQQCLVNTTYWDAESFMPECGYTEISYGLVSFVTTPSNAAVYVDGTFVGYSGTYYFEGTKGLYKQTDIYLKPGWHRVIMKKSGYRDYIGMIYVYSGNSEQMYKRLLMPNGPVPGTIRCDPGGKSVMQIAHAEEKKLGVGDLVLEYTGIYWENFSDEWGMGSCPGGVNNMKSSLGHCIFATRQRCMDELDPQYTPSGTWQDYLFCDFGFTWTPLCYETIYHSVDQDACKKPFPACAANRDGYLGAFRCSPDGKPMLQLYNFSGKWETVQSPSALCMKPYPEWDPYQLRDSFFGGYLKSSYEQYIKETEMLRYQPGTNKLQEWDIYNNAWVAYTGSKIYTYA